MLAARLPRRRRRTLARAAREQRARADLDRRRGRARPALPPLLRRGAVRVPLRDPAQPAGARLGRRARRLDRPGRAAARRDRRGARRPDARARVPARGGAPLRRPRRPHASSCPSPAPDRVASIVERDGRPVGALVHDESLCDEPELVESVVRRGRARARQRAARGRAAGAVRVPQHDRRHGAEPARHDRHRGRDPQPQPGDRRGERLRRATTRCAAATSGTSSSTTRSATR